MKEKLKKLKHHLVSSDDFQATFEYFFIQLAIDQNFMKLGETLSEAPVLETAITQTMESLYKHVLKSTGAKPRTISESIAFVGVNYIKEFGFYHGFIKITNGMGSYIYFDEVGVGLTMVKFSESTKIWYSRFTTIIHDGHAIPYVYPKNPFDRN